MAESSALRGKVVVVTGGARGIGRVGATALTAAGARVAIGDIDGARAGELAGALGGSAIGLALDVSSRTSFEGFLGEVERRLGPPDVLVGNAGILPLGEVADASEAELRRVLDVNFGGVLTGCRLVLPRMRAEGRGQILNLAPAPWLARLPGAGGYNAAGHAVIALTRTLQAELRGSGVQVKLLLVGPTDTEMLAGLHRPLLLRPRAAADVGGRLVAALESDHGELATGRLLGAPLGGSRGLVSRLTDAWLHLIGADRLFVDPDPLARAAYQARIGGGALGPASAGAPKSGTDPG